MYQLTGLKPVIAPDALLVVLGSFPGKASLEAQQYYAFKRNHFWPIVCTLLGEPAVQHLAYERRIEFLKVHRIALWDVYAACIRSGSLDADIRAGQANDLAQLKRWAPSLKSIAHNGQASAKFKKVTQALGVDVWVLPSTSPANATWSFERKLSAWKAVFIQTGIISSY